MPASSPASLRRLGLITSQAYSLVNFRGPLIRAWVARGIHVCALAPDYDDATRGAVAALGAEPVDFRLDRAGLNVVADLADLIALTRLLRRLSLDASFAYFIKPAIYGSLAARLAGVPRRLAMIEGAGYVFADDAPLSLRRRVLRGLVTHLYRVALRSAERVFFLNRDDVDLFVAARMASPAQLVELPGIGVDLAHFASSPPPDGPPLFLLVARMLAHKGVREFVEAARRVRAQHPQARFVLLGSPDANPASVPEAELRAWHEQGVVEWQPFVADVRPWLAAASVLVLPSWYREGVPRSIQEAMAAGRAVITTDTPGCRDTVLPGETGFLVPPRDGEALVAALMRFVENAGLAARMGAAARQRAEARYDVHVINARILAAMGLDGNE